MLIKIPIVFVGPIAAGKSVLSAVLSDLLQCELLCIDKLKEEFFLNLGYSESKATNLLMHHGLKAYYDYLKNFEFLF